ncbi:methyl-accepting chemotaxis protein [Xylophilus sp. Leaf220]|uniref:methyl-accepting chemotaxis protein n=1 Tax=Xylophilus sp. Leaf220 TaxID=1735686 RepID=UPI0006F639DE|nr:methyl-accepting chemotaxis protein [Xylophilus sp. Leaf220]KQM80264.1 chemotaxis protein [Xylophilus sp. Leaf220]
MAFPGALQRRIDRAARQFAAGFSGGFALDRQQEVDLGGRPSPALFCGGRLLNGDFSVPDRFTADSGVRATVFARQGDDFMRVTTSVQRQDGARAVGTLLDRSHPAYRLLVQGRPYAGYATVFGRQNMTHYDPVRDASGEVVGVLYVGLDVSEMHTFDAATQIGLAVLGGQWLLWAGAWMLLPSLTGEERMPWLAYGTAVPLATAALVYGLVRRGVAGAIDDGRQAAQRVAGGDLTTQLHVPRRDDVGQLLHAINGISVGLAGLVGNVRRGAESLRGATQEIAAGNDDLATRTELQAGEVNATASAMEQLTATVVQNADNAQRVSGLMGGVSDMAARSGSVVGQVVHTMGEIRAGAHRIQDIIGIIDGIAFQTNILALNAAVEAARAGEQGRGFAVVASEVRALAQRSADASREIRGLIAASVGQVDAGSGQVESARVAMDDIIRSIGEVSGFIDEIASASREQRQGIESVNQSVGRIEEMTQQNAALVEEAAAAAGRMREQAAALADAAGSFKVHI